MEQFSLEEINLMCIYDTSTLEGLLVELEKALPILDIQETELRELIHSVRSKLQRINDEEYRQLVFVTDFEEENEE